MGITIQVLKYGEIKEKRDWSEGRYTIGRNETCDIGLDDPHISLTHAEIDVDTDKITIRDTNSKNGLYFDDKQFASKTFKNNFEVELGPYILKGIFQNSKKSILQGNGNLQNRLFSNIRVLLTLSLMLMVVLTSFFVFTLINHQIRIFKEEELRKRGNLFSLYLAKLAGINQNGIILDPDDRLLIKKVAAEEGINFAVIADYRGQILAPEDTGEKIVQWDGFNDAIKEKVRKSEDITENQKIIFYPIKNNDTILGGAVIKLDTRKASQSGMSAYFAMILFVLLILCILIGRYVTSFFLRPLQSLGEEVSVAIKENSGRINFHSSHAEIADLIDMFNRLLQNSQHNHENTGKTVEYSGDIDKAPNDKYTDFNEQSNPADATMQANPLENELIPAHKDEKLNVSSQSDTFCQNGKVENNSSDNNDNTANRGVIPVPQCIINVNNFMIVACNPVFKERFNKASTRKNLNFAEVFEDPLISNAVYELIAGIKEKTSVAISDTCNYLIIKGRINEKKGLIQIVFKESPHV
ncbi:FHA domain-containing protein [Desulfococcaceae bacterium HSG7]|nr:FHA domain-containing protein [Desulfococcaceae bacterium HSG7]